MSKHIGLYYCLAIAYDAMTESGWQSLGQEGSDEEFAHGL